jgi:hypothetical protein
VILCSSCKVSFSVSSPRTDKDLGSQVTENPVFKAQRASLSYDKVQRNQGSRNPEGNLPTRVVDEALDVLEKSLRG